MTRDTRFLCPETTHPRPHQIEGLGPRLRVGSAIWRQPVKRSTCPVSGSSIQAIWIIAARMPADIEGPTRPRYNQQWMATTVS